MPREMKKVVTKHHLKEHDEVRQNLEHWLSRPPEERVAEVHRLRAMFHGGPRELKRVARIIRRAPPAGAAEDGAADAER